MSLTDLVKCLKAINACDEIESTDEDKVLNWGYITDRHQLIQEAVGLADQLLIMSSGDRNLTHENELSKEGFYVSCLERDGFSWLVGGIHTDKGIIAYG
jgi:hypothetical protein